jgi:hypothetical protein
VSTSRLGTRYSLSPFLNGSADAEQDFSSLGAVSHRVVYEVVRTSGENHSVCVDEVVIPEYEDQIRGIRIVVKTVGAGISKEFTSREMRSSVPTFGNQAELALQTTTWRSFRLG